MADQQQAAVPPKKTAKGPSLYDLIRDIKLGQSTILDSVKRVEDKVSNLETAHKSLEARVARLEAGNVVGISSPAAGDDIKMLLEHQIRLAQVNAAQSRSNLILSKVL